METGRKELVSLTSTRTMEPISPERKEQVKVAAQKKGLRYVELPVKGVFTIKPHKFRVRIAAFGNKTAETYGKGSAEHAIASLDVTAAHFLECSSTPPRTSSGKLQPLSPGHVWLVHKTIYGVREAPNLRSEERSCDAS